MRWPGEWTDPLIVDRVGETPVNCLIFDASPPEAIAARAKEKGLAVFQSGKIPGVIQVKGEWPGVRVSQGQSRAAVDAGPTGAPWIDSNGWRVRLEQTQRPGVPVWVDATPPKFLRRNSYLLALADAAMHGGQWIITIDSDLARGLLAEDPAAQQTSDKVLGLIRFFRAHKEWGSFKSVAAVAVVSDFSGDNELIGHETLNLTARTHQPFLIIEKAKLAATPLTGVKAIIYPDGDAPAPEIRRKLLAFVEAGGLLVIGPKWGLADSRPSTEEHPRFSIRLAGKGRVAVSKEDLSEPFLLANDARILFSYRNDILRFWNAGSMGSYYTQSPDGKTALVQLANYATEPARFPATMWIRGTFRAARFFDPAKTEPEPLKLLPRSGGAELHLPPVAAYAAIELDI